MRSHSRARVAACALVLVVSSGLSRAPSAADLRASEPITAVRKSAEFCPVYPIALPAVALSGAAAGQQFTRLAIGGAQGIAWLTWSGNPSAQVLERSLVAPGDSLTYINPDNAADHRVDRGDWIAGLPGSVNAAGTESAFAALVGQEIVLPVWSESRGPGNRSDYRVAKFVAVRLSAVTLSGQGSLSFQYLRDYRCYNVAPVATGTALTTQEDSALAVPLQAADANGDALTYTVTKPVAHGVLTGTAPNLTYTPAANFFGQDELQFRVSDGDSESAVVTVSVAVNAVNDAPTAAGETHTTAEDTTRAITLQGADVDGDALSYTVTVLPLHGTLTGTAASLSYAPARNFFGEDTLQFRVSDGTLDSIAATLRLTVSSVNDAPTANSLNAETEQGVPVQITLAGTDIENDALSFRIVDAPDHGNLEGTAPSLRYVPTATFSGGDSFRYVANDGNVDSLAAVASIQVTPGNNQTCNPADSDANGDGVIDAACIGAFVPPNPTTVAPPHNPTIGLDFLGSTDFLISGPQPIQRGIDAGVIERRLAAVIRGRVLNEHLQPLSGVLVRVVGKPEFGYTYSRADGQYDLLVNGGGALTVDFTKEDYLRAQRQTDDLPWQAFGTVEDVALIQLDPNATRVTLGPAANAQVVRGSVISDDSGSRQATLFVPAGTEAVLKLRDGTQQPVSSLNLRATEYTVGDAGPKRMPGALPVSSGYTYAVELSADEAIDADAESVTFNRPTAFYVENFLEFPVGTIVPVGHYDFKVAAWRASNNGVIVKILGVSGGTAQVDLKGEGVAATVAELAGRGIDAAELTMLAQTYAVGTSLWRAPIPHLTPWDLNYPVKTPDNAILPIYEKPKSELDEDADKPDCEYASVIGCQNSSLGEAIPIAGTDIVLRYHSDRSEGVGAFRGVSLKLSDAAFPPSLKGVRLVWDVAGQKHEQYFEHVAPGASLPFTWNGKDAYGRDTYGTRSLKVDVSFVYGAVYTAPAEALQSFGLWSTSGTALTTNRERAEISLSRAASINVRGKAIDPADLGGFYISDQHAFDMRAGTMEFGHGGRQTAESQPQIGRRAVGSYQFPSQRVADGMHVSQVRLPKGNDVKSMAILPDGGILIADQWNYTVWKAGSDGIIRRFLGTGSGCSFAGMGAQIACIDAANGSAPATAITWPMSITVGKNGCAFVALHSGAVIRVCDGRAALIWMAPSEPNAIAISNDGRLFVSVGAARCCDGAANAIYQVDPDTTPGSAETQSRSRIAGTGVNGYSGNGGPAINASLDVSSMVVSPDGLLYLTEAYVIRRVERDGRITRVAGRPSPQCDESSFRCDSVSTVGLLATESELSGWSNLTFLPNGEMLFVDRAFSTLGIIRRIDSLGVIREFLPGVLNVDCTRFPRDSRCQLDTPAPNYHVGWVIDLEIAHNGTLLALGTEGLIHRLSSVVPGLGVAPLAMPSPSAGSAYDFDDLGLQYRARDAITGVTLRSFERTDGRLTAVIDAEGRHTRIERSPSGVPVAIVAPHGQRTELELNAEGKLAVVRDPLHNEYQMTYHPGGLLKTFQRPGARASTMTYAADGRLESDVNPLTGGWVLNRGEIEYGRRVQLTSAEGRTQIYDTQELPTGEKVRTKRDRDGALTSRIEFPDGRTIKVSADGSETTVNIQPDTRFGLLAPLRTIRTTVPGLATLNASQTRSATLDNPNDPLSVRAWTETSTVNGRAYIRSYDATTRTLLARSPMNRTRTTVLNADGKPVSLSVPGLASVTYGYDAVGRVDAVTQTADGITRTTRIGYDAFGFVSRVTDPSRGEMGLSNDAIGLKRTQTLPDRRQIGFDYDPRGNVTAITPPGRAAHVFRFDELDQLGGYTPPRVAGGGTGLTDYIYNLDRQVEMITRSDGAVIDPHYHAATGQLSSITTPEGSYALEFLPGGRLQTSAAPGGNELRYDWFGPHLRSVAATGAASGMVTYGYNANRWLTRVASPGLSVVYGYDNDGFLTSAQVGASALTLARKTENGLLEGTTIGSVADTWSYNGFAEPVSYIAKFGTATPFSASYTRDDLGRIDTRTEVLPSQTTVERYAYDAAGRLETVHRSGALVSDYRFDGNGNREGHRIGSASPLRGQSLPCLGDLGGTNEVLIAGQYDAQDRMTTYGTCSYRYTANGELEQRTDSATNAINTYRYDVFGNLRAATLTDGTRIDYDIDGRNRRIGKRVNGTRVQAFLYLNQLEPIAELDGSGNVMAHFVYADRNNTPSLMLKGGKTYRVVADHLGSVRLVIDVITGEIAQRMAYDEYGNVVLDTSPGFQPFGYAGGIHDRDTGLVRFGARDYDPLSGRWTAKDPIGFEGGDANVYAYVHGDPVGWIDPSGLAKCGPGATPVAGTNYSVRIDPGQPNTDQQTHAHIYDKRGNEKTVVNQDGTGSHGCDVEKDLPKDKKLRNHLARKLFNKVPVLGLAGVCYSLTFDPDYSPFDAVLDQSLLLTSGEVY